MTESTGIAPASWPWSKRLGFAFLFVFVVLTSLPMPFAAVPYGAIAFRWLNELWINVVPWVGRRFFDVNSEFVDFGSGDTPFHYVRLFVWAVAAFVLGAVGSVLVRESAHYDRLYRVLLVFVRFALAYSMISYGSAKVIPVQFPRPSLDDLVLTYGASSPFRLAYVFMGVAPSLQIFAGWVEVVSGLLLTVRRTALLGALMATTILISVALFNFGYGIPAKIQVLHLLLLAMVIVSINGRRVVNFALNRPALPFEERPIFRQPGIEKAVAVLLMVVTITFTVAKIRASHEWQIHRGDGAPRSPLRGIWDVEVLKENGVERPPLMTDKRRWRRVVFDGPLFAAIYDMDDTRHWFHSRLTAETVELTSVDGKKVSLAYVRPDPRTLVIETTMDGRKIHAVCRRLDEKNFPLVATPFRWSTAYPIR